MANYSLIRDLNSGPVLLDQYSYLWANKPLQVFSPLKNLYPMYDLECHFFMIREEYFIPIREVNSGPLGWVVQMPISAHPGLKVNLLFCFHTFSGTVSFQVSNIVQAIYSTFFSQKYRNIFLGGNNCIFQCSGIK